MEEDRVGIASIRPPQDDYVSFFQGLVGTRAASRSEDRRQTDDAGSVSSSITAVDVVGPDDPTGEPLGGVVHLVGGLGAAEHPEGRWPVGVDHRAESLGGPVQGLVP